MKLANTYRISARGMSADSLVTGITDTMIPVISNGAPTANVEVTLVAV